MNEAFKRKSSEDLVWPTLDAANDPTGDEPGLVKDYRITLPDAVPQVAPHKPTPIAAFPAQSDTILQPNQPSAAEEALADRLLRGRDLKIITNEVPPDTSQNIIVDTEAVIAAINSSTYGENLDRIKHQDGKGPGIPKTETVLPGRPEDLKLIPKPEESKLVQPGTPIQTGTRFSKPGEIQSKIASKPSLLKRLFG